MVVLEKSEAGSRCVTNGIFAGGEPMLGGTTDATASSVRPIWDECCFLFPSPCPLPAPFGSAPQGEDLKGKDMFTIIFHPP